MKLKFFWIPARDSAAASSNVVLGFSPHELGVAETLASQPATPSRAEAHDYVCTASD